jgi:hypothetical protein
VIAALIDKHRESYFAATKNSEKKDVTERILSVISGRFLKKAKGKAGWVMVTGHPRRVKVAQALQYRQRIAEEGPFYAMRSKSARPLPLWTSFKLQHSSRGLEADKQDPRASNQQSSKLDCVSNFGTKTIEGGFSIHEAKLLHYGNDIKGVLDLFEPYKGNEPRLCTNEELLWALGYPTRLRIENEGCAQSF